MDNKINFTGAFLIYKPKNTTLINKICEEIIPTHRQIAKDLYNKGDLFFANKDCYDRDIVDYLKLRAIKFQYYPNINLKCGLNSKYPSEVKNIIEKSEILTDINAISDRVLTKPRSTTPIRYRWKENDHINQTIAALKLNPENYTIITKKNRTNLVDRNGILSVVISPKGHDGRNYAIAYSKGNGESTKYYTIDYEGNIESVFTDIEKLPEFKKKFINNMRINKGRIRPTK